MSKLIVDILTEILEQIVEQIENDADEVVGEMRFRKSFETQKARGDVESAHLDGDDGIFQTGGGGLPYHGQQPRLTIHHFIQERLQSIKVNIRD